MDIMLPLPEYTADSSPPSYEEVASKLESLLGNDPTTEKALSAARSLSNEEIIVLANGYEDHYPLQTEQQKADFVVGAGQHLSSEEGQDSAAQAGLAASQAAVDVDNQLLDIQSQLAVLDQSYHKGFADTVASIRKEYNQVLQDTRLLAADIAQKGRSFDVILVQYCADSNYPIDERKSRVASFISDISKFESTSQDIQQKFETVKTKFASFVETFTSWANGKEGELTDKIEQLVKEIRELNNTLNTIKAAQTSMAALAAAALPAAVALGTVLEPLKPIILIGGLIVAGVSLAASIALIIASERVQHQINDKTSEKEDLEKELERIRNARQQLQSVQLQKGGLPVLQDCIDVLPEYWKCTLRDAQSIHGWLEQGGETQARPMYMSLNVEKGIKSYDSTAAYLEKYSRGR
ncbi:hypothetical protein F4809DRAFT_638798 [Biscogniauxia mediterranea]|nr:hypothetical protein F4809DRAFT_638798 [Biscogniauxia mediterranea]